MRSLFLFLASALVLSGGTPTANDELWPRVLVGNEATQGALRMALVRASGLLARPECRVVLDQFRDRSGNRLSDNLKALGVDERTYLKQLVFRDGSTMRPCDRETTFMFTTPGSRVVFVCDQQMARIIFRQQTLVTTLVIHEALHTLGLGENPPRSDQITARVAAHCPG